MRLSPADLKGISQLAFSATAGITDLVEAMHHGITSSAGRPAPGARTRGITGSVYGNLRGAIRLVGDLLDLSLSPLAKASGAAAASADRGAFVAALNGVLGDHLLATDNPLAIQMSLHPPGACAGASTLPDPERLASGKIVVFVHGLCMTDLHWQREGQNHAAALARELGYAPLYLRYNSGLHISTNGRGFSDLLEQTLAAWPRPVEELVIIGYSMGGLVTRSACQAAALAAHGWLRQLRKIIFLGTPHHGTPFERGGNWLGLVLGVTPYAAPLARLGRLRSAGITDLRYGNLLDEDWAGADRFAPAADERRPVPLPEGVQCFAAAAALCARAERARAALLGDGLVPVACALGLHRRSEHCLGFPRANQWVGYGMSHLELLSRPEVYAKLREWIAA